MSTNDFKIVSIKAGALVTCNKRRDSLFKVDAVLHNADSTTYILSTYGKTNANTLVCPSNEIILVAIKCASIFVGADGKEVSLDELKERQRFN